ncbi:fimbria/pilus periplasmic chaperone [Enterobacteriaceae bacterium Kacie_13]|nr:fimbria/pilus periplasmic chaperone [Enterobacteriaceae bacterium Kacie_13]
MNTLTGALCTLLLILTGLPPASASIALGRTRVIFNAEKQSQSFEIKNNSDKPYLVQAWLEDEQEKKITEPFIVLPPVQRIEGNTVSQIKIQGLPQLKKLPQVRESVFYLNIREIPPKSDKPNQVQLAVQSRIKVFYRPDFLKLDRMSDDIPGAENIKISCSSGELIAHNPTPYYFTLTADQISPVMIAPNSDMKLALRGTKGVSNLFYITDYGKMKEINNLLKEQKKCGD